MKILVGYDESKVAEAALKLALKHARAFGAELFIVTSLDQNRGLDKEDIESVEDRLERLKITHKISDMPCETHVIVSSLSPGEDLVEFARENGIDEIVIGVTKRSKVGKLVFGSNAQYIILQADCTIVTVK